MKKIFFILSLQVFFIFSAFAQNELSEFSSTKITIGNILNWQSVYSSTAVPAVPHTQYIMDKFNDGEVAGEEPASEEKPVDDQNNLQKEQQNLQEQSEEAFQELDQTFDNSDGETAETNPDALTEGDNPEAAVPEAGAENADATAETAEQNSGEALDENNPEAVVPEAGAENADAAAAAETAEQNSGEAVDENNPEAAASDSENETADKDNDINAVVEENAETALEENQDAVIEQTEEVVSDSENNYEFQMGIFDVGAYVEIGDVAEFNKSVDELNEELNTTTYKNYNSIQSTFNKFNSFLSSAEENLYANLGVNGSLLAPIQIYQKSSKSTYTFDYGLNVNANVRLFKNNGISIATNPNLSQACKSIFDPENEINDQEDLRNFTSDPNFTACANDIATPGSESNRIFSCDDVLNGDCNFDTLYELKGDTTLVGLVNQYFNFDFGYSTLAWGEGNLDQEEFYLGELYLGGTLRYVDGKKSNVDIRLDEAEDIDIQKLAEDNQESFSYFDIDFAATYYTRMFTASFTLEHLMSPSIDYGPKKVDFGIMPRLNLSYHGIPWFEETLSVNWSEDFGTDKSSIGEEYKWRTISLAWVPQLPIFSLRLGKRWNNAGSKLSFNTLGFSLFNSLHVDAAFSDQKIILDGSDYWRSVMGSIALDIAF